MFVVFPRPKTTKKMRTVYKINLYDYQGANNFLNEIYATYEEAYTALENSLYMGECEIVKIFIKEKTSK